MIGRHLAAALSADGWPVFSSTRRPENVSAGRPHIDLLAEEWPIIDELRPAATILCAAVARLGDCARDPALSERINVDGPVALARQVVAAGGKALFLSSDKVFDGSRALRRADEPTCPTSVYGRQKAAAEQRILALPRTAVLRLSKVVEPEAPLFANWAAALRRGQAIEPFTDLTMAPVPVATVAAAVIRLTAHFRPGIWQLSGPRDVSYAQAADWICAALGADSGLVRPVAGRLAALGLPDHLHTSMDSEPARRVLGVVVPDAVDVVRALAAVR